MTERRKILLVGLDQAGKTSILNILHNKYTMMDNIKPTAGIERDEIQILGIPILCWDLGGQLKFREGYIKDVKIFAETDSLFYVVDALNPDRYEESLQYYTDILENFKKLDLKTKVVLCIHKIDPNIRNNPHTLEIIDHVKQIFEARSSGLEVTTFITSIYDRKSIVDAFSKNFQELIVTLKPFRKLLESLRSQLNLDGLILFDNQLYILSEAYRNHEMEETCLNMTYNSVYYMSQTNPQMADKSANFAKNFEFILNLRNKEKRFNFMEVKFKEWEIFLLTVSDEKLDTGAIQSKFNSMVAQIEI
ncbi:MAG: GTP-binding protein [Candidatus Helarchaeota archaeon]|nr:GTP-binding protein [Candidatus Helarchaeota archaeon]